MCKIVLSNVTLDPPALADVRLFASHEEALAHLCDHVLTREESHHWSIFIAGYRKIVDPREDIDLDNLATAFWHGEKLDKAQHLYDEYAESIANSLVCSISLGWFWEEFRSNGTRCFGIGTDGVFVIWGDNTVVSGMLPFSAAKPPVVPVSHRDRLDNPRPRSLKRPKFSMLDADTPEKRYKIFKANWLTVRYEYFAACKEGRVLTTRSNFDDAQIPKSRWKSLVSNADGSFPNEAS